MHVKELKIAIIGTGRIASSLAAALQKAGVEVAAVKSRKINSAKRFANRFNIKSFTASFDNLPEKANVFFLAVPDDHILAAAASLNRSRLDLKGKLFVHLSGAKDIFELNLLRKKAKIASLHIMQSFPTSEIVDITDSYAAVETDDSAAYSLLSSLARKMKLHPIRIASSEKAMYHLSAVFAVNFLVSNLHHSKELFRNYADVNLEHFKFMEPIVLSVLKNVKRKGTGSALSGPIERGEVSIIKKHINVLKDVSIRGVKGEAKKLMLLSYLVQSLSLLEVVKSKNGGLSRNQIKINNILRDELEKTIR